MSAWRKTVAAWLLAGGASIPAAAAEPRAITAHDRSFWRGIVQNHTQNAKDLLRSLYVALVLNKAAADRPRAEILKTLEKIGG